MAPDPLKQTRAVPFGRHIRGGLDSAVQSIDSMLRAKRFEVVRGLASRRWLGLPLAWASFGVLASLVLTAKGVVTKLYTHDLFFVFDAMWRIFVGQLPYRDFHSPIGAAFFLPFMMLKQIEPFSLLVFLHANLLVATGLLLLTTITLPRRFAPLLLLIAALGVALVVITPRSADRAYTMYSLLAPYNRWCEAATMVITLVALSSPREKAVAARTALARLDLPAAVALSTCLAFVFHVKVTYFVAGAATVVIGVLVGRLSLRCMVSTALLLLLAEGAIELTLHVHGPYLADLRMTAKAASTSGTNQTVFKSVGSGLQMVLQFLIASVALLLLATYRGDRQQWWLRHRRTLTMATAAYLVAFFANTQNHWQAEIPMMCSILLVVAETARRAWIDGGRREIRWLAFGLIVLVASKSTPAKDIISVIAFTVDSLGETVCALPIWHGTPAEELLFPKLALVRTGAQIPRSCDEVHIDPALINEPVGPAELDYSNEARVEAVRLTAARQLLGKTFPANASIFAMAFSNPYSAFTGTQPPRGAELWWDYGRNYSGASRPDADLLFSSASAVLVSRFDKVPEMAGGNMTRVFGPDLIRYFRPVSQNLMWQLWLSREAMKPASQFEAAGR